MQKLIYWNSLSLMSSPPLIQSWHKQKWLFSLSKTLQDFTLISVSWVWNTQLCRQGWETSYLFQFRVRLEDLLFIFQTVSFPAWPFCVSTHRPVSLLHLSRPSVSARVCLRLCVCVYGFQRGERLKVNHQRRQNKCLVGQYRFND